jgi:SAM-dependent methyltransferase
VNHPNRKPPLFDTYATEYDAALAQGLSISGENKEYFARGRALWLARRLVELGEWPSTALDFGCGTGSATPYLLEIGFTSILGIDVSAASIEEARRKQGSDRARFLPLHEYVPTGQMDLAFCNGVFHHIPMPERAAAVRLIHQSLRPQGLFSFWENNPWNPGTRYVMSRIPFDRDTATLTPPEAGRLLAGNGFDVLRTDYLFIFPRALKWLRPVERLLCRLPLGGQYQILCRRRPGIS